MRKIQILPEHLANQIAAGEVVERPSAVVKELLENSLDAGATRISIAFKNGGKSYICVEDNGHGMGPEEALLCLKRHATSKIGSVKDLAHINSFGFRGEAIPSIASVSHFCLKTRAQEQAIGTEILINSGRFIYQRAHGMAIGTRIEVLNLFNSVPARRKFMKTEATETAHIVYLVRLYALSHPNIAFKLTEDGREIFHSPAVKCLIERIHEVWNKNLGKDLIVLKRAEGNEMGLEGVIGKPGVGKATKHEMVTYINKRPIESKALNHAIVESYHTFIPKGRYPIAFLFLDINPEYLDVNVHPAKREVRFRNEGIVRHFIISHLLEHLQSYIYAEKASVLAPSSSTVSDLTPLVEAKKAEVFPHRQKEKTPLYIEKKVAIPAARYTESIQREEKIQMTEANRSAPATPQKPLKATWKFLAYMPEKTYCLFEAADGIIVLNIKAAKERIWYERIQESFKMHPAAIQPLLLPLSVQLDAFFCEGFESCLEDFKKVGLQIEPFGRGYYRIEALPEWLTASKAECFIKDTASLIREHGTAPNAKGLLYEKIAKLAATESLAIKKTYRKEEMEQIVNELLACQNPLLCPKGNLTYFELSHREMEKRLKR